MAFSRNPYPAGIITVILSQSTPTCEREGGQGKLLSRFRLFMLSTMLHLIALRLGVMARAAQFKKSEMNFKFIFLILLSNSSAKISLMAASTQGLILERKVNVICMQTLKRKSKIVVLGHDVQLIPSKKNRNTMKAFET